MVWGEPFERPHPGWFFTGGAGFDYGKGLAYREKGNAWVRGTTGWHALNRFHDVKAGTAYTVSAMLRLSPGLTDGYFSVREARELNGNGRIMTEVKLVGPSDYRKFELNFTTNFSRVLFYVGLWGTGRDVWIQIDDFIVAEKTPSGGGGGGGGGTPSCGVETRLDGFGQQAVVRVYGQGFVAGEEVQILRDNQFATSTRANGQGGYSVEYSQATALPTRSYTVYAQGVSSGRKSSSAGYSL